MVTDTFDGRSISLLPHQKKVTKLDFNVAISTMFPCIFASFKESQQEG